MSFIDYIIFGFYMLVLLYVGIHFYRKNNHREDYYVGNRSMSAGHVGLSIVATDVGGGFSIGLGGVGFLMGLSGSWLLFTGLIGAWFSAVFIIPRIKKIDSKHSMLTYPDFLRFRYGDRVALVAAVISGIGYLGFTSAQMLAGAKLASATIFRNPPMGMDPLQFSLIVIAVITVTYTVFGGLKAVIYTDSIQWAVLLVGLIAVTIPVTVYSIGGLGSLKASLPSEFFTLTNISPVKFVNWLVTIVPIWIIGMTIYQRMFACKTVEEAKKAWYIAGIFEYPVMAFTGVFLGMCARVVFPESDPEMAMPRLIAEVLPVGVTGIVIAAYFSAIMSTADSCLMASSGNVVNDVMRRYLRLGVSDRGGMRLSMIMTFVLGALAVLLSAFFTTVLDAILYAYAFMASGLFIPTLGAYFWKRSSRSGAFAGMIAGGGTTLALTALKESSCFSACSYLTVFDPAVYGVSASLIAFVAGSFLFPFKKSSKY